MRSIMAIGLAMALAGCEAKRDETISPADNTGRNERDRSVNALTPMDQGESEADRTVTQHARQNVVGHDGLSVNAKNVKIITRSGVVTLRGPVESDAEKGTVGRLVTSVAGVQRVDNQLEVAGSPSEAKTTAPGARP